MWDQFQWCARVCGFTAGVLLERFHVFQIAELCLLFALAEGTCCFGAGVLNNSGWTGESSWKNEEVRTEHRRKKVVQLSYQSSRVWWRKNIKYIWDYPVFPSGTKEPACNARAAENGLTKRIRKISFEESSGTGPLVLKNNFLCVIRKTLFIILCLNGALLWENYICL